MDSILVSYIICMAGYHVPQSDYRVGSDLPPLFAHLRVSLGNAGSTSGSDTTGKPHIASMLDLPPRVARLAINLTASRLSW
jgi:hypothetical protein